MLIHETRKEKRPFEVITQNKAGDDVSTIEMRDTDVEYLIYELACDCGEKGGSVTFEALTHGRESEEALEAELDEKYTHTCHVCCCVGRTDPTHPSYGSKCKVNIHA